MGACGSKESGDCVWKKDQARRIGAQSSRGPATLNSEGHEELPLRFAPLLPCRQPVSAQPRLVGVHIFQLDNLRGPGSCNATSRSPQARHTGRSADTRRISGSSGDITAQAHDRSPSRSCQGWASLDVGCCGSAELRKASAGRPELQGMRCLLFRQASSSGPVSALQRDREHFGILQVQPEHIFPRWQIAQRAFAPLHRMADRVSADGLGLIP